MANDGVDKERRRFLTTAATVVGGTGAVIAAVPFVEYMEPSERAKAVGAPVEVDISKVKPGEQITAKWRGQPIWILHRTEKMLDELKENDPELSDPKSTVTSQQPPYCKNEDRSIKPQLFVCIGICTHLGCSPNYVPEGAPNAPGKDWHGGYLCPCHGSKFDLAGRVYKGVPAPTNLVIPPYKFVSASKIIVGADEEAAS
jgi:ubiquinol-cytochrome c reductase iron-sulfur subunit